MPFFRVGLHIIPLLILVMEYISISVSLKIAQTMGDYTTVDFLGGLLRLGDNISYHSMPTILLIVHLISLILALLYFYMVTLHGLGRERSGPDPGPERVTLWGWDDN